MFNPATHRIVLYECQVALSGETFTILLAEYPTGRVQALATTIQHDAKIPPVESEIARHLKISNSDLQTLNTTTNGGIIYAAMIRKGN